MIGICALCRNNRDLQKSHLIPQWAYKRILKVDPTGETAPLLIAGGKAVMSNKQTTKHLLCAACEQRFSNSEDHVAKLTEPNNGQIKLFEKVMRLDTPQKVGNRLLIPLSDGVIFNHLAGEHTVGVYPLLEDDCCYFIAVDFDEADWRDDARAFMQSCHALGVPAALEVSRSGQGAHMRGCFLAPAFRPVMRGVSVPPSSAIHARAHGN